MLAYGQHNLGLYLDQRPLNCQKYLSYYTTKTLIMLKENPFYDFSTQTQTNNFALNIRNLECVLDLAILNYTYDRK